MEIVNSIANWLLSKRIGQIERFMYQPHDVQQQVFQKLLHFGKETKWGKEHGLKDINTQQQYAERVPLSYYEDLFPYIERQMKGEQGVLWPTEVKWFAKSSGTTNARSKFIPMPKESLEDCHYKGGKDLLSLYINNFPESRLFVGKNLAIGGSYQVSHLNPEMYYGDVSAVIMKNLPIWAELRRAPDIKIALMDQWEEKIEKMAKSTINENITSISGVPTWTIVLLEKLLEVSNKSIKELWPNLEVFMHGAVAFGPYQETFNKLIDPEGMFYMEVYNASEGFFGMQDQTDSKDLLLMLDYGVYYEFIPMEELENEHPKTIGLSEVEIGKNYAIVITTNGGLWRYVIGDTVKFTSTYPYRIRISGRTKHFINAFGEEVIIENAEHAITEACQATGAKLLNFTAAPIYLEAGKKGGHEWVIEFEETPNSLDLFTSTLDQTLRSINSDYDAKRQKNLALVAPKVHLAPKGTFYQWMKSRGKLGGQHKVPRLSNNRNYIDDILKLLPST